MVLRIVPYYGTSYTDAGSVSNAWQNYSAGVITPVYDTSWFLTNGATFELTGMQLEVGDTASSFEHRSYGVELARCRRYFFKPHMDTNHWPAYQYHTSHKMQVVQFPVQMRAIPTCTATWANTSSAFTQYYLSQDHFKAYNGSAYNDTNSFYMNSFQAAAEL